MGQVSNVNIPVPSPGPDPATKPAETQTTTPPVTEQRPAWLPEKFKTAEDFAKSYAELEKKLGGTPAPAATTTPAPATEAKPTTPEPANLDKYEAEFAKEGKLSEQSYQELATKNGLSKQAVDNYIAGAQARAAAILTDIQSEVGGKDQYESIIKWAASGLSPAEIEAYNTVARTGDPNAVKMALKGVAAKYTTQYGREPNLSGGRPSNSAGPVPFTSSAEVVAAMADPRYRNGDQAYIKSVQDRLINSKVF